MEVDVGALTAGDAEVLQAVSSSDYRFGRAHDLEKAGEDIATRMIALATAMLVFQELGEYCHPSLAFIAAAVSFFASLSFVIGFLDFGGEWGIYNDWFSWVCYRPWPEGGIGMLVITLGLVDLSLCHAWWWLIIATFITLPVSKTLTIRWD